MLLKLLQFAPRQSTALCHEQPLFMAGGKSNQFSAGREPGSELPAVRRCSRAQRRSPASLLCRPPPRPVRLSGQTAGGPREFVEPVHLVGSVEGMNEDDEVIRDG